MYNDIYVKVERKKHFLSIMPYYARGNDCDVNVNGLFCVDEFSCDMDFTNDLHNPDIDWTLGVDYPQGTMFTI